MAKNLLRSREGAHSMIWRTVAIRTAMLSALWWTLTGGAIAAVGMGVASVACAVTASLVLLPPRRFRLSLKTLPFFLGYFLMQSIKGGVQVATIAMRPRLDLQPATLEFRLHLPDESSRIFLACILNLLPGTLSAGLTGDLLLLHVIDIRLPVEREVRKAETYIARLLRVEMQ